MEAWSPLGRAQIFNDPVLVSLARKYERTPAQIILRWHVQTDTVAVPKSVTPARIIENKEIFDFSISEEDVKAIDALDRGHRFGSDPDNFHFDV